MTLFFVIILMTVMTTSYVLKILLLINLDKSRKITNWSNDVNSPTLIESKLRYFILSYLLFVLHDKVEKPKWFMVVFFSDNLPWLYAQNTLKVK